MLFDLQRLLILRYVQNEFTYVLSIEKTDYINNIY